MDNIINYKKIMNSASLDAVKSILVDVSNNGLPGDHHFYITFDMSINGVETSIALKEKYPHEMTIVIQNWYEGLIVRDSYFSITLNFGNVPETMQIPFSAIKSFVDPSVEFGLSFDIQVNNRNQPNTQSKNMGSNDDDFIQTNKNNSTNDKKSGEVVSIESFRKS